MAFKSRFASLSLFVASALALPASPNETVRYQEFSAASLIDTYDASNWLSKFDVQAIGDPTHGYVHYVDAGTAQAKGYLQNQGGKQYMGVDMTSTLDPNGQGRDSVRLQSKSSYNHGLIIADFAHVPGSICGSWPAFWMLGPNWPNEIDIYEGVNLNTQNQVTLHTSAGCVPSVGPEGQTGSRVGNADCGANGGGVGCGTLGNQATSYGTAFDANGGGVYATLWTGSKIDVWYFAARNVPGDINSGNPNPNGWGQPQASYAGCNFDQKLYNMNLIFDITFCGDWAGAVWGSTQCASVTPSCNAYVAQNPQAFGSTYWLVNSVKVYSA